MIDVMIYKNDSGYWRVLTHRGESPTNYTSYEDAVYSLPMKYWAYFI
jgi:hypothetical protein